MKGQLVSFIALLAVAPSPAASSSPYSELIGIDVDTGYNVQEVPRLADGQPLLINVSINVRNVLGVDEKKQIISLESSLRLYWTDPRVHYRPLDLNQTGSSPARPKSFVTLHPKMAEQFWVPDIFLDRAKDIRRPSYLTHPTSLRVYPNSVMRFSSRFNFDVACSMDFHNYPADKQLCYVNFESFSHTSKHFNFNWRTDLCSTNPNISLAQFTFDITLEDTYTTDYYDLAYPGFIMKIALSRQLRYHLVQTYIPSAAFVFLAWGSLFISHESIPGRIGMNMTTLLTLMSMFSAVRSNVPKVSYISLLDVWMLTCIVFVLACIIEFIMVLALIRRQYKAQAESLDHFSRIVVPVLFLISNLLYWTQLWLT